MKLAVVLLLLVAPAFGQDQLANVTAACGPKGITFDVHEDNSQHTLAQPAPGKALVYIISQSGLACGGGGWCVMKAGLDGTWVGAFKRKTPSAPASLRTGTYNSYLYVSVEPGEHHACVSAQSGLGDMNALIHFSAEAGKSYYLGITGVYSISSRWLTIGPLDTDEARYLIATTPLSVSQLRK